MACLHSRTVWLHTYSFTYHIFAWVVSHCLPCSFRLPECPPIWQALTNCRGFPLTSMSVASRQLLMLTARIRLTRRYRVTRTQSQHLGDLTQPLAFLWPTGIPFVCISHISATVAHPNDVDAPTRTNLFQPGTVRILVWVWKPQNSKFVMCKYISSLFCNDAELLTTSSLLL